MQKEGCVGQRRLQSQGKEARVQAALKQEHRLGDKELWKMKR